MSEITSCCVSEDCCGESSIIEKVKDYYGKLARFRYIFIKNGKGFQT